MRALLIIFRTKLDQCIFGVEVRKTTTVPTWTLKTQAACYVPHLIYFGNKIYNIATISRPRHVHIDDVDIIPHDHSHQAVPCAIAQVRTEPVALRGVVVRAKHRKYLT